MQDWDDMHEQDIFNNKTVFIDFYMENCYWCYDFQKDWNKLVTDVTAMYGQDQVLFVKIDGD